MKTITTYLIFLLSFNFLVAQGKKKERLISKGAYSKMISEELSYLVLGKSSPQQGIGVNLNEKKTNIKISGLLGKWANSLLIFEADLGASNGVYFFDNENGSKNGKISFNWIKELKSMTGSVYINNEDESRATKELLILELLENYAGKFTNLLDAIESSTKASKLTINKELKDEAIENLKKLFKDNFGTSFNSMGYDFDMSDYIKKNNTVNVLGESITSDYNLAQVYADYRDVVAHINDGLEDEIYEIERKTTADHWTSHKLTYLGVKGYYERESFRRFTYDETKKFSKMFADEKGDLMGGEFSVNYAYIMGERNRWYQPDKLFARLVLGLNRASNIGNFKHRSLSSITSIGNDVNNVPINTVANDLAFIGDATYIYGLGSSIGIDLYLFPREEIPVGLFAELSHNYVSFDGNSAAKDIQLTPLRLGLLFNLKNEEKDKPLFTLSVFMDRADLSTTPKKPDNDLRFGIGVGIPVNFR